MNIMDTADKLEMKVHSPYHMDGVEDLLAGAIMFFCGAVQQTSGIVIAVIFVPVIALGIRKFVTFPRVGFFMPKTRPLAMRLRLLLAALSAFVAVPLLAVLLIATRYPHSAVAQLLPLPVLQYTVAACLVLMLVGMGLYTAMSRWFAYAALALVLACTAHLVHWSPLDGTAVAGVVAGIYGVILLFRFIRKYPVLSDDPVLDGGSVEGGQ